MAGFSIVFCCVLGLGIVVTLTFMASVRVSCRVRIVSCLGLCYG
jgi:hypothetical protein